ncbi:ABC transporter ATP-binding protein [Piscinibacter koreensis]|uniref:ABC transporter ATP-binding protein n=1 Tax=Piscinibacter koreensis TaxID=2742824 RepID=A0A7Y6NK76_9BURK|nr:ABC transporter ATP-binding protein [Schlegelella koreensis]NUZ04601.1 ABC transporter ATP-binding protein [Schlegelella koreensis]
MSDVPASASPALSRRAFGVDLGPPRTPTPLLEVRGLHVAFGSPAALPAVDGVDLSIDAGEVVGVVGESGSGKSVSALAVMGLVDDPGRVAAERLAFDGRDLLGLAPTARRALLGRDLAMIFQDPQGSLNPAFTVEYQLVEALRLHEGGSRRALRTRALELLRAVEIPDAERRLAAYPHQLSGGMAQRVMLAMAIACDPRLLIADEPTTALDVTIQAQMLALLKRLQRERGMALLLITHDLGVIAEVAQRVVVMYAGQVVETAPVDALFARPHHPYTAALLAALPERNAGRRRLRTLGGVVPAPHERPAGCLLAPRCAYVRPRCVAERPALFEVEDGRAARCFFPLHTPHAVPPSRPEAFDGHDAGDPAAPASRSDAPAAEAAP